MKIYTLENKNEVLTLAPFSYKTATPQHKAQALYRELLSVQARYKVFVF